MPACSRDLVSAVSASGRHSSTLDHGSGLRTTKDQQDEVKEIQATSASPGSTNCAKKKKSWCLRLSRRCRTEPTRNRGQTCAACATNWECDLAESMEKTSTGTPAGSAAKKAGAVFSMYPGRATSGPA
eukprot:scaffold8566_cov141-Isochrysis_galbana.AAC.1